MLNFDSDANLAPIVAGQRLENVYVGYGVSISVLDAGGAIAFASSDPNGASVDSDSDLGTPNEIYGGPGEGNSGASNTVAQHNLLIRAEKLDDDDNDGLVDEPDDDGEGATFRFGFDTAVCLNTLVMIDIDDNENVEFTVSYAGGQDPNVFVVSGPGDNSRVDVDFVLELEGEACNVSELTVALSASGGIDDLGFCYDTCDEDNGDGDGDANGDACPLIVECVEDCEDDDIACVVTCLGGGSEHGVTEATTLLTCATDHDCEDDDDACIAANCTIEDYECANGPATCSEAMACISLCGSDEDCAATCTSESTQIAQGQLEDLQACASNNACIDTDTDCLEQFCAAELYTCTSGLSDGLACPIAADCIFMCNNEPVCELNCQPVAPGSETKLDAVLDCGQLNECDTFACTNEICPQQWSECISGDQTCPEALACVQSCYDEPLCEFNCFSRAQLPDLFFLDVLLVCINANNCQDDQGCIVANCGAQLDTCENG